MNFRNVFRDLKRKRNFASSLSIKIAESSLSSKVEKTLQINLSKEVIEKEQLVRPQEPIKPYSFYTEDITFENKKARTHLAGTLTLPQKECVIPAVILLRN